ncbi:hypothetical protein GN244_ATG18367 [Phytophthora infestans]|uniref:RxLR effector protein n=1 Tax=Phytophthora infestans TaxID=4787 RepID=A0A833SHT9_PHYIN|nr:hypothetical protein GN244_ATG18367 [Phytophthora infestans]
MRIPYLVAATLITLFASKNAVLAGTESNQAALAIENTPRNPVEARVLQTDMKRSEPSRLEQPNSPEKLKPTTGKLKSLVPTTEKLVDKSMAIAPVAYKLIPIFKPIAEKLKTVSSVKNFIAKLKAFVEKIKTYKVGEHTIGERYTMAKFELWFKQNKTPNDVKAMLKAGEGAVVNTKNHDLSVQYNAFYKWAQRDKEVKAAKAAAAAA